MPWTVAQRLAARSQRLVLNNALRASSSPCALYLKVRVSSTGRTLQTISWDSFMGQLASAVDSRVSAAELASREVALTQSHEASCTSLQTEPSMLTPSLSLSW